MSPAAQMRAMEPAADEEYTLGGGDEIAVEAPGHPELSGKHVVGPDGRISLPTAGTVNLGGMTREQAATAVQNAYSQYYRDVTTSVSIEKYGSNRILLLGAVEHPGVMYFDQTPTLLEAITRAGLVQESAMQASGGSGIKPKISGGLPQDCKIYRGTGDSQQIITVNLHQMLASGNAMADMRLRRNDIVFVPNPHDRFVSVLGQVQHPGAVELNDEVNLPTILSEAGGLTEQAGSNPTIAIVDQTSKKVRYVKFKDLLTVAGMNEVSLHPGDLIFVPKSGIAKVGFVLQQISPITSLASVATLAGAF
jgi:polysaccharide export outer membrane protein